MLNVSEGFSALRKESGQVVVFFALFIPVAFGLAAIVMDIGNWYVHKRHLQTQVDAAALSPARQFTGCFDTQAWDSTNTLVREHSLGYAGDTLRPGVLGSDISATTNLQVQEPNDVRIALNSSQYWEATDGTAQGTSGYANVPDNTMDRDGNGDTRFCDERYIDVKATDDAAPLLWGLIPFRPSPKSHARAALYWEEGAKGILPFAVPEVVPGAVAAIFVDEDTNDVISANELGPDASNPTLSRWAVYSGAAGQFNMVRQNGTSRTNVGVYILLSRADNPEPDLSGSLTQICGRTAVRCYARGKLVGDPPLGLALIHGFRKDGGSAPVLRQTRLFGCNSDPNFSGPYFSLTGDCDVSVEAEISQPSGGGTPSADLYTNANCSGNSTPMSGSGTTWTGSITLPEPDNQPGATGQVPLCIRYRKGSVNAEWVFARPYVANGKSGPIEYLSLAGNELSGLPFDDSYAIPNDVDEMVTYSVTVGLRPPLRKGTLGGKPVLIRYATEDDPSLTQSIDCDVDNYKYPAPYDTLPADVAEIANGCVTPYLVNPTLDCSSYGLGDLPPAAPPATNWDNAPDCAQSKNGQVQSLQKGLVARLTLPDGTCAPNNWPNAPNQPITQQELDDWLMGLGNDPRLVTLVVTEFAAFSGSGSEIIPIRYFAGFYITGKDVSQQSPQCSGTRPDGTDWSEDPHPIYGDTSEPRKQKLDDGDVWGYWVVKSDYSSTGQPSTEPCDFSSQQPRNCVLTLVE